MCCDRGTGFGKDEEKMVNKVIMMGRLVETPELKQTQGGTSYVSFRIAVERKYVAQNGTRETDFFTVEAWRGTAEFISRNFTKGRLITIIGSLENNKWQDAEGNKRVYTKIKADEVDFAGDYANPDNQPQQTQAPTYTTPAPYVTPPQRPAAQPTQNHQQQMNFNPAQYNPYAAPATPAAPPQNDDDLPF